jgi:hypothetical protein
LEQVIKEAIVSHRVGCAVLGDLLRLETTAMLGFDIAWFEEGDRRRRKGDEHVPPLSKCKMSILGITANVA